MSTPATPDLITEYAGQLAAAAPKLVKARRNLHDAQPGFPTSTPGAAPATGGNTNPDPEGHIHLTIVEKLASAPDPARQALERLEQLPRIFGPLITEYYSLCATWGQDPHRLTFDPTSDTEYCQSCLRIDVCSPRHRGPHCQWCGNFLATENRLPSTTLLTTRHRGTRITQAMVIADRPARTGKRKQKR